MHLLTSCVNLVWFYRIWPRATLIQRTLFIWHFGVSKNKKWAFLILSAVDLQLIVIYSIFADNSPFIEKYSCCAYRVFVVVLFLWVGKPDGSISETTNTNTITRLFPNLQRTLWPVKWMLCHSLRKLKLGWGSLKLEQWIVDLHSYCFSQLTPWAALKFYLYSTDIIGDL